MCLCAHNFSNWVSKNSCLPVGKDLKKLGTRFSILKGDFEKLFF